MDNPMGASPVGPSPKRIRLRTYEIMQQYGSLSCKHCNHRADNQQKLDMHEQHHFAYLPFRCQFCTFSSKNSRSLGYHTNRVHLEQKNRKLLDDRSRSQARKMQNVIQPGGEKVDIIDITTDSDDEEMSEGEMIVPLDLSRGSQLHPRNQDEHVSTTQSLSRSSESSVHQTVSPQNEEAVCRSEVSKLGGKIIEPIDLSHGGQFDPRNPGAHVSNTQPLSRSSESSPVYQIVLPLEEEAVCSSEVKKLVPEIQTAFEILLQTEKSLKEARIMQMAGSRAVNDFRKKLNIVEREDRSLSAQLAVLTEQDESLQQRLKVLAAQKTQLDEEINKMRHVAISKRIKLEFVVLDSSQSSVDLGEEIRQKRRTLIDATEKLAATLMEKTYLANRIRAFEDKKKEITPTLVKMRAGYSTLQGNSTSESTSALGGQLKTLVGEQCMRIERYVSLEKKLAKTRFDNNMDEIDRKKERLLNALKNCGDE